MERKLYLGKTDGYGNGRKSCKAFIIWELANGNFSMCAEVWNSRETNTIMVGQCVGEVAAMFPGNKKAQRMVEIWERYHLNDMKAGCLHQREAKWNDARINPAELPNSHANRDAKGVLAIWVTPQEHKDGLLTKPCRVCGYKYGTAWLKEEIPSEVIAEIESW